MFVQTSEEGGSRGEEETGGTGETEETQGAGNSPFYCHIMLSHTYYTLNSCTCQDKQNTSQLKFYKDEKREGDIQFNASYEHTCRYPQIDS